MHRLESKTAVMTGSAHGIGFSAARLMASEGAQVLLADLDAYQTEEAAEQIRGEGGVAVAVAADVTDENSLAVMVDEAVSTFGGLHVLCNNVGGSNPERDLDLLNMDMAEWDRVMNLDLRSTVMASRLAIPHMIAAGGGSVINTASVAGIQGDTVQCAYGASKAAVISLTRYIAAQYGPDAIRCNAIAPGAVMTPALQNNLPTDTVESIQRQTPLGHIGQPDDIAYAMLYLASDEARHMTGQCLVVDGGTTSQSAFAPGRRKSTP